MNTSTCPWFSMVEALATARAHSVELRNRLPMPDGVKTATVRSVLGWSPTRVAARRRDGLTWVEADELAVRVLGQWPWGVWPEFEEIADRACAAAVIAYPDEAEEQAA